MFCCLLVFEFVFCVEDLVDGDQVCDEEVGDCYQVDVYVDICQVVEVLVEVVYQVYYWVE